MTSVHNSTLQNSLDAATVKQMRAQDKVTLVDVREPIEYAGERIADAKLMPLSSFNPQELPWEAGKTMVLYCQSSNRSGQALSQIQAQGIEGVLHLQGGLNAWKKAGLPTLKNKNAPISIMRQVQIIAGSLVLTGTVLGVLVSPYFLILSGFVGAGLTFAGVSGNCMMANILAKLPYNQP